MCFTNMAAQLGSESRHTNWTLCKVYINRQRVCPTGVASPAVLPLLLPLSATGATYRGGRKILRLGAPLGSNGRQCWYTAGVGGEPARQLGLGPAVSSRRRKGTHLGLAPRALLVPEEIVHLVSLDRLGYSVPFFPGYYNSYDNSDNSDTLFVHGSGNANWAKCLRVYTFCQGETRSAILRQRRGETRVGSAIEAMSMELGGGGCLGGGTRGRPGSLGSRAHDEEATYRHLATWTRPHWPRCHCRRCRCRRVSPSSRSGPPAFSCDHGRRLVAQLASMVGAVRFAGACFARWSRAGC